MRPSGLTDAEWAASPVNYFGTEYLSKILAAMENFAVFPYDPHAEAELNIMRAQTEAMLAGKLSVEEALAAMESDMQNQIGNPYEG